MNFGKSDYSLNAAVVNVEDPSLLATAATDAAARIWDIRMTNEPAEVVYHEAEVRFLCFILDLKLIS